MLVCLPLAAPIGLWPLNIPTLAWFGCVNGCQQIRGGLVFATGEGTHCIRIGHVTQTKPPTVPHVQDQAGDLWGFIVLLAPGPHLVQIGVNSIAFGKSTSQRIYREQHTPKIGWKLHKYRLKHALHTLDDHFR